MTESPGRSRAPASITMVDAGGGAWNARSSTANACWQPCAAVVLDFLQSKCLVASERALRTELELMYQRGTSKDGCSGPDQFWQSRLEKMLSVSATLPRLSESDGTAGVEETTQMGVHLSQIRSFKVPSHESSLNSSPPTRLDVLGQHAIEAGSLGVSLYQLDLSVTDEEGALLRRQRARSTQHSGVVFRDGLPMTDQQQLSLEHLHLPLVVNPNTRGFEDSPELVLDEGALLAGRYRVTTLIGGNGPRTQARVRYIDCRWRILNTALALARRQGFLLTSCPVPR